MQCKNPTCSRELPKPVPGNSRGTYCTRKCQLAMRSVTKGRALPDVWVGMDTYYALHRRAEILNLPIRDLVVNMIEASLER